MCLSVSVSICLFVHLSIRVCISICTGVRPSVCLSVCPSILVSVCPCVHRSVCVHLCLCVYICLSYISVYAQVVAKDANVMLVTLAAKCIALIAIGLRKKFSPHAIGVCLFIICFSLKLNCMLDAHKIPVILILHIF